MKIRPWMAIVGAYVTGCGAHDAMTSSDYAQAFDSQIDALGSEQTVHFIEIAEVTRVDQIGPVEQGHAERIDDHLASMGQVMGGMMSCTDEQGSTFDAVDLAATTHDLRSECDEHGMLMLSAHDMESARAEEARHQRVVGTQIDKLRRQLDAMVPTGSRNRCSPCPGCGM